MKQAAWLFAEGLAASSKKGDGKRSLYWIPGSGWPYVAPLRGYCTRRATGPRDKLRALAQEEPAGRCVRQALELALTHAHMHPRTGLGDRDD